MHEFFKWHNVPFEGAKIRIKKPETIFIGTVTVDCGRIFYDFNGVACSLLPFRYLEPSMGSSGKQLAYLAMAPGVLDTDPNSDWHLNNICLPDCTDIV